MEFFVECSSCGKSFDCLEGVYSCDVCGSRLEVSYPLGSIGEGLDSRDFLKSEGLGLRKYLDFLPILDGGSLLCLGEGGTPLVECGNLLDLVGVGGLFAKNETVNPTGTFKDRSASVGVGRVVELGGGKVVVASDGNVAPATSAFATRAGLESVIILPEYMEETRIAQTVLYGSEVFVVEGGDVNDCIDLSSKLGDEYGYHHLSTAVSVNPYQLEGSKTIGFEICEQLGWEVPDWVVVPVGGGGLLTACWKAFREFFEVGLIDSLPRIVGVQSSACDPVVRAYNDGDRREIERIEGDFGTIAVPIAVPYPLDGGTALDAIFDSGGVAVSVKDGEIREAQKLLAKRESIVGEPAGVASLAGVRKLSNRGVIGEDESVVFVVTGTGLREIKDLRKEYEEPYRIKPSISEIFERISL